MGITNNGSSAVHVRILISRTASFSVVSIILCSRPDLVKFFQNIFQIIYGKNMMIAVCQLIISVKIFFQMFFQRRPDWQYQSPVILRSPFWEPYFSFVMIW